MRRAIQDATGCGEALSRLPKLGLGELRQQWRVLYKAEASPHLSRELLLRAVAYRMQEVALGGLRPQRQRQLREFAQQLNKSQEGRIRPRPELKPGTRLVREWQGRTYEVLVLDDRLLLAGHRLPFAFRPRAKDHRHSMVGTALLRIEAEPHHRSQAQAGTRFSRRGQRCRELTRAAGAARSTPANPPRRGWSRTSTRSTPSARPARPTSRASSTRAGGSVATTYDDGGFSGGTMERPALQRLLADIRSGQDRHRGRLQGRPADPLARRLRQDRRALRRATASPSSRSPSSSTPPPRWAG